MGEITFAALPLLFGSVKQRGTCSDAQKGVEQWVPVPLPCSFWDHWGWDTWGNAGSAQMLSKDCVSRYPLVKKQFLKVSQPEAGFARFRKARSFPVSTPIGCLLRSLPNHPHQTAGDWGWSSR